MTCHACGEQHSDRPLLCPNCGADLETEHGAVPEIGSGTTSKTDRGADSETGPGADPETDPGADGDVTDGGQKGATRSQGAATGAIRTDGGQRGTGSAGGAADGSPGDTAGGPTTGTAGQDAGGGSGGIKATISELPLLTGAFAGFIAGIAVILVGVGVALAVPPSRFPFGTLDIATISLVDLHFGLGSHIVPRFVFARFQQFAPPSTLVGLLYLLPPLFLYTAGKGVSSLASDADSAAESLLNGATVVLGYFPVVFLAILLLPGGAVQIRIATPLLLAGIVYPLLFGTLGGIAQHHFPGVVRRVGVGYGVALILAIAFLMFLVTFVIAGSLTIADRLVLTTLLLGAVQTLSGVGGLVGAPVLAVLAGIAAFAIGFLRTWRADRRQTIVEGITRPLTAAWTYALGIAVLVTAIPVFADSYAARELHLGGLVSDAASAYAQGNLVTIGDFVELVVLGSVVFPVALGCAGGLIAAVVQYRQGARAEQAAAAGGGAAAPEAGGDQRGPSAGSGAADSEAGAGSTGPTADDEPLASSAGGGRAGPEPGTDTADSAPSGGGGPGAAAGEEDPSDAAADGPTSADSPADEPAGDRPGTKGGRGPAPGAGSGAPDDELADDIGKGTADSGALDDEEADDTGEGTAGPGEGTAGSGEGTAGSGEGTAGTETEDSDAGEPVGESDRSGGTREDSGEEEDDDGDDESGFDWGDEE